MTIKQFLEIKLQVATLALCLLSGCYGHAGDLVRLIGEQVWWRKFYFFFSRKYNSALYLLGVFYQMSDLNDNMVQIKVCQEN